MNVERASCFRSKTLKRGQNESKGNAGSAPSKKLSLPAGEKRRPNFRGSSPALSAVAAGPEPIYAVREHYCPRPIAIGQIGQKFAPSCGDARRTSTRNDTRPHTRRAVVEVRS
jgi:hypothetical protein